MLIPQPREATEQTDTKPGIEGVVQADAINLGLTTQRNLSLIENII